MRRFLAVLFLAVACATPRPKQDLGRIVVREFEVGPPTTAISNYDEPTDRLGMKLAEWIAAVLQRRGRNAVAVPRDSTETGDLLVAGRLTRIDGGSRGARAFTSMTIGFGFTSYGAGGSTCALDGQVTRPDSATAVWTFARTQKKRSTGWFWARFGESSERQIADCLESGGNTIAYLVDTGRYGGGLTSQPAPGSSPVVATTPVSRSVADRLRELDRLRKDGLVTDSEYERRRAAILESL